MLTRRHLLQSSGGLLALGLAAQRARGERGLPRTTPANAQFFVFVQVYGAWDVCLAFDPKDRDAKLPDGTTAFDQPYAMSDVKTYGDNIALAPNGQVLGHWADRMAVINGFDMEIDNGHIVDTMMAGSPSPRTANLPWAQAVLAKRHPYLKSCSVPHVYTSYDGQFFAGPYGDASISATTSDFLAVLGSAGTSSADSLSDVASMIGEYQTQAAGIDRRQALGGYKTAVNRAVQVGAQLKASGFTPPAAATEPTDVASLLGQLFASGVLGSATLSFGEKYFFDTHADHYKLHPLGKAMADLDTFVTGLSKVPLDANTSVLQRTTIVVAAEFCRTPRLNGNAGKDHNFRTNSLALLGYNVKPGVYGASGYAKDATGQWQAHIAQPVDFATGTPKATGDLMHARNLWAGMGSVLGTDLSGQFGADTRPISFLG